MKPILQAKGLQKEFEGTAVLKGVDMTICEGEFIAVMGQSGSGKSTLLYNISGMDRANGGEILLNGNDIASLSEEAMSEIRLERMGFIFQQSFLLKSLSIFDNIVLPGLKAKKLPREQVIAYAKKLTERTGIASIHSHDIKKVSGGQLQRAAICRALINNPEILFADEPTGALNSSATKEIMDIMNEVNQNGTAIMLVTHDARVAARADRVVFLADGNVIDDMRLGKFQKEKQEDREHVIAKWLEQQGF